MKGTSTAVCSLLLIYYECWFQPQLGFMLSWKVIVYTTLHTVYMFFYTIVNAIQEETTI